MLESNQPCQKRRFYRPLPHLGDYPACEPFIILLRMFGGYPRIKAQVFPEDSQELNPSNLLSQGLFLSLAVQRDSDGIRTHDLHRDRVASTPLLYRTIVSDHLQHFDPRLYFAAPMGGKPAYLTFAYISICNTHEGVWFGLFRRGQRTMNHCQSPAYLYQTYLVSNILYYSLLYCVKQLGQPFSSYSKYTL